MEITQLQGGAIGLRLSKKKKKGVKKKKVLWADSMTERYAQLTAK